MLSQKVQVKHFRQRWHNADKSLGVYRKKKNDEALHKLRVEMKKMKAMLLLQSGSLEGNKLPKEFKALKKVFKAAGEIREAGVHIKLLKEHRITDKEIRKKLEKTEEQKGEKFRKKVNDHKQQLEKSAAFFQQKFKAIPLQKLQRLINSELHQLSGLSQVRLGTVKLHLFRKKLKNLVYIHAVLPAVTAKKMKLNIFYLKKLEETIGDWHDVIRVIELLKEQDYTEKEIPGKLVAERLRMRKKVNEMFLNFMGNALVG